MTKLKEAPKPEEPSQAKLAIKKFLDDALKKAGIKVLKHQEMKRGFTNAIYGCFYTVKSNSSDGKDVLPFYVHKNGEIDLGVASDDFIIGKYGDMNRVVKNLKDFKKSDLDESVNESDVALPGNVKRFMEKFVDALDNTGLSRKRKVTVLASIIDALDIEPQKLIQMVQKIKAGYGKDEAISEGVNKRLNMMDELIQMVGSEEKLLEEVFRALSDREAKEIYDWIERHYS